MKQQNQNIKTQPCKKVKKLFIKLLAFLRRLLILIFNPRFLLCFGIAWIITNGWSYVALWLGTLFDISWLMAAAGAYVALLWLPITPEKLITLTIALLLLRKLFPNDERTLGQLRALYNNAKKEFDHAISFLKSKRKEKSNTEDKNDT